MGALLPFAGMSARSRFLATTIPEPIAAGRKAAAYADLARQAAHGGLPDQLPELTLHPGVPNDTWRRAATLAHAYLARIKTADGFSQRFASCIGVLERHIEIAAGRVERLG